MVSRHEDLNGHAKLFETSVRLSSARQGLQRLIREGEIDANDRRELQWAGKLWGQMDWDSPSYRSDESMAVIATILRPYFFDALIHEKRSYGDDELNEIRHSLDSGNGSPLALERAERIIGHMSRLLFYNLQAA